MNYYLKFNRGHNKFKGGDLVRLKRGKSPMEVMCVYDGGLLGRYLLSETTLQWRDQEDFVYYEGLDQHG